MFDLNAPGGDTEKPPTADLARESESAGKVSDQLSKGDIETRHRRLMSLLKYEGERQAEERRQMDIDEQFYDHCQWTQEDAQTLMDRGQAPIVRNESRMTIDWLCGTEARTRKDYKILPREKGDQESAEVKEKLVKYTDDANSTQWQRSRAFKQFAIAGLSWLEEGLNLDPEREIIYSGREDWRNVLRDSHSTAVDYNDDARYLFRKRTVDLDYAAMLMPKQRTHLIEAAETLDDRHDGDDPWYMGERLSGASEVMDGLPSMMSRRSAYISHNDRHLSPRKQVELIECWYRVPERAKVFAAVQAQGRLFNPLDPSHQEAVKSGAQTYEAVKMRMRLMIATRHAPCMDVATPFSHQRFPLIPLIAYRRAHDGMVYGVMRGMRDAQESLNKRHSKALFALSSNRVIAEVGAVDDLEELRLEAARPDGIILRKAGKEIKFDENQFDFQGNMQMAAADAESLRNAGGVTNENLGRDTNAASGKAILAKQDQGSLTTMELFDRYVLAIKQAGELRLANIEQFYTEPKVVRIVGENKPVEWVEINKFDPDTGEILNDVTASKADFIVDTQDYRSSAAQAALEGMLNLLTQIAPIAPQVVLSVLDLVVESTEVKGKDEWVTRIRGITGQRDPSKPPTPEEEQAKQEAAAKQTEAEQLQMDTAKAQLSQIQANVDLMRAQMGKLDSEEALKRIEAMLTALQTAQAAAATPGLTPVADEIGKSAGAVDKNPGAAAPLAPSLPPELPPQPEIPPQPPFDQGAQDAQ